MHGIQAVGAYIHGRRRARGLTQAEVADLAGVTRALVIAIEHGKPTLRIDGVERVLNVFGKTLGAINLTAGPPEDGGR